MTVENRSARQGDVVIAEILSAVHSVNETVQEVNGILRSHMHDHEMNQQALERIIGSIRLEVGQALHGFPNNDPKGHREYHEARINEINNRAEFWRKMTFELSKWGLVGFLGWAALAMWQSFLHGPK